MGGPKGSEGSIGSSRQIRAEQWGAKRVRGAEMDQIAKFVLNNGGAKGVRGVEMDPIAKFVLNNGGPKGQRGRNGSNRQICV